jgi:hypothetical protein
MAHEIELEYTDRKLNKREEVWYRRRRSAWFLAAKLGDVTQESYDKAFALLNSCKNVSLGFQRCDEIENESNWKRVDAKRDKLIKRMDKLNDELRPYGCHMQRAWSIEDVYDYDFETHTPLNESGYLHFFD